MKLSIGFLTRAKGWPLALLLYGSVAWAQGSAELPQAPVPNVATKLPGGVLVERATPGTMPLSLDEAIDRGLKRNLQMELVIQNERLVHGELLSVENNLLPSLTASARSEAQEINLAALGFKSSELVDFGISPASFSTI